MPAVYVETCYLEKILTTLPELPPHNWLISGLECYDYTDWDGCEKWAETELFLSDEGLLRDVSQRNMQIIWGVFSAIPAKYTKEDVYSYSLPDTETPYYMSSRIVPRHPLALLELYVEDGCSTIASAHDANLLQPLYKLPYKTRDEEAYNQRMNALLRRIQRILRKEVPEVSPELANEVQWGVWRALFRGTENLVDDDKLHRAVMAEYHAQWQRKRNYRTTYWDPFTQE